jgi:hypothetical protein
VIPDPLYVGALLSLGGEHAHLFFHLNLHNRGGHPLRLTRVTFSAQREGRPLSRTTVEAPLLARRLRPAPWIVMRDAQTLAAAHRWRGALTRPKGDTLIVAGDSISLVGQLSILRAVEVPDRIECLVEHDGGEPARRAVEVRRHEQRTALRLPVTGRWWVMEGHRFDEDHAGAVLNSQNFAYDLGVLGDGATTFSGSARRNASYHAHGQPIVAAADGEVVWVHDGVEENEPVGVRPSWQQIQLRPYDLAGNFVVLRHLGREHTAYLHLQPKLTLRRGDRVRAGQEVGRCGNSGNSLESHLHFQLQDGPDVLRANGLPARFGGFTIHFGHLRLYVTSERPLPLPVWLLVESGRSPEAIELPRSFTRW